jgi:hypothetical protein
VKTRILLMVHALERESRYTEQQQSETKTNFLGNLNEPSPERAPGYRGKGLRPDVSGRHPSPKRASGNCAVWIKARWLQQAGLPDFTNWRFITLTVANRKSTPMAAYLLGYDRMRRFLARFREASGRRFLWF